MASGDAVVQVIRAMPPAASVAGPAIRQGGSTPAEVFEGWAFDAATDEYMDFLCAMKGYAGGGLTFILPWSAASATTGVTRWGIAIRRLQDDVEDIDTAQTYDFNEVDDTTATVSGEVAYATVTFTNGVDMDSWADGELAVARIFRNADHANDTMTGDAQLWDWFAYET